MHLITINRYNKTASRIVLMSTHVSLTAVLCFSHSIQSRWQRCLRQLPSPPDRWTDPSPLNWQRETIQSVQDRRKGLEVLLQKYSAANTWPTCRVCGLDACAHNDGKSSQRVQKVSFYKPATVAFVFFHFSCSLINVSVYHHIVIYLMRNSFR